MVSVPVLSRPGIDLPQEVKKTESPFSRHVGHLITDIFQPIVVKDWMKSCPVITPNQQSDELLKRFREKNELECIVVCDEQHRPLGLIMKSRFFRLVGSLYGASLFGHKPASNLMDSQPLCAEITIDPQELIDRALSRAEETFYDAVLLTDNGKFVGVLTMNDLLNVSRLLQREAVNRQIRTIRDTENMITNMHESIANVTDATKETQSCSERIAEITDQGRDELGDMLRLFTLWSSNASKQEEAVLQLKERTTAVDGISRLISDLAEQCNLLAVNATIEAARAGEQGKGFGVVANEIRILADQTKRSTTQISSLIKSMAEAVNGAVNLVGEGKKGADKGFSQVKKTEDTFAQLWSSSELNHDATSRLMDASREAKDISDEVRKEFHKLVNQMG
ncbi:methyl-accepting chemotaxis protein [Cohnella sp. WQ 127256]|uniref:methyl-accepting chemotaxis protein n=1 Tax=Cohnella sp. WQ 127256 TaxID=2938790 RepID=UPI002118F1A0|nr:methyl-accepting chemotaxis protein [Cohnella sp. WQ 127256]